MDKGQQLAPVANHVIATVEIKDKSKFQKAVKWATAAAASFGVAVVAHADGGTIDFTAASSQLSSAQTAILGIIATLITIFGIVIAWRTFRRSAG